MKVAIIGLGVIGKVHLAAIKQTKAEIVALCDIDKEKLLLYNGSKGVRLYYDYEKMLEETKPDIVHICTPHYLHADMIVNALKRDINVLCEKPLCIKEKDINRIINAEKKSKAMLGICQQNRYNEINRYLKRYLSDKKIKSAQAVVMWSRDKDYYNSAVWRGRKKTEGGGVLINQALHTVDLMQWFCGMPESVVAQVGNLSLKGIINVEDTASLLCKGKNDFIVFATNTAKGDFAVNISFIMENGDRVSAFPDLLYINGEKICSEDIVCAERKSCYGNGHEKLIADFYNCVETGRKFSIDGQEGAKAVKIILSAYKSKGREILCD